MQLKLPQYNFKAISFDELAKITNKPDLILLSSGLAKQFPQPLVGPTALMYIKDELVHEDFTAPWVEGYLLKNMTTSEWIYSITRLLNKEHYIHPLIGSFLLNQYRNK